MQTYEKGNVIYGVFSDTSSNKIQEATLGELISDWNRNVNYVRNTQTTWTYTANIQRHILSFFPSDFPISKITPKTILEYFCMLKETKGFKNNTINKHRTHLMTLFEYAILNDSIYGIIQNPVRKIKPLRQDPYHHQIYQPEDAKKILSAIRASGKIGLEVAVSLALYCGCRREEVCALRWENVNLAGRTLTICETRTTAGREIVEMNHTKNHTIREIGIPDALYDVLTRARKCQQKNFRELGSQYYTKKNYVLCERDGHPWHPNNVTRRWSIFIKSHNFPYIRYHDLRHTNLSLLMTKMSAVDVAKLGGHTKVSTTTNIYGHSFNNALKHGIETMNELL